MRQRCERVNFWERSTRLSKNSAPRAIWLPARVHNPGQPLAARIYAKRASGTDLL